MTLFKVFIALTSVLCLLVDQNLAMFEHLFKKPPQELINEYNKIIRLDTGYDLRKYQILDVSKINADSFGKTRSNIFNCLMCGYTYDGLHYFRLTRSVLEMGDQTTLGAVKKSKQKFSFVDQALSMLLTAHKCYKSSSMEPLWWLYLYSVYFDWIVDGEIKWDSKMVESTCQAVEKGMSDFLYQTKCDSETTYNDETLVSRGYLDLKYVNEKPDDLNRRKVRIVDYKDNVSIRIGFNYQLLKCSQVSEDLATASKVYDFTRLGFDQLVLSDQLMEHLMSDFGELIDWRSTSDSMSKDFGASQTSNCVQQRFAGLGRYLSKIVTLLKIIMTQILIKHVYLIEEPQSEKEKTHDNRPFDHINDTMNEQLGEFMDFVDLHDDVDLLKVNVVFAKFYTDPSAGRELVLKELMEILEKMSAELPNSKLSYLTMQSKLQDAEYVNTLFDNIGKITKASTLAIDHKITSDQTPLLSLLSGGVFVGYLQYCFENIRFQVVRSFIAFSRNLRVNVDSHDGSICDTAKPAEITEND